MAEQEFKLIDVFERWWDSQREKVSAARGLGRLLKIVCEFLRDSLPARRRQRYGDVEYDWEHRVDTTSATVNWRTRLAGLMNSPYQPVPPDEFRNIMGALAIDFSQFTFIDIGSGKGRALLLACDYGFRRVVGIELIPELDRIARENVRKIEAERNIGNIELICGDATTFVFPFEPSVVFLFNPLPEPGLRRLLAELDRSLRQHPRKLIVVYANPVHERTVARCPALRKIGGTLQYSIFGSLENN